MREYHGRCAELNHHSSWPRSHASHVLDGATLGASQRAEGEDPAMNEGDQEKEKEVWVAAGQVLVEMHVTDWATAQKRRP